MTNKSGTPYKHNDLPPRSDPTYMKLYREKFKEVSKIKSKEKLKQKLLDNPNFYKENYKRFKDKLNQNPEYKEKHKIYFKEKQWKARGIIDLTYDRYLQELANQSYTCKICKRKLKNPQADHCHETGKFRGILCVPCNNGLGIYEKKKYLFEQYSET